MRTLHVRSLELIADKIKRSRHTIAFFPLETRVLIGSRDLTVEEITILDGPQERVTNSSRIWIFSLVRKVACVSPEGFNPPWSVLILTGSPVFSTML